MDTYNHDDFEILPQPGLQEIQVPTDKPAELNQVVVEVDIDALFPDQIDSSDVVDSDPPDKYDRKWYQ